VVSRLHHLDRQYQPVSGRHEAAGDNYSEASMDPYFLERVEVMRGPTSVLYGKSNPGGIVSMVSKRPTTEPLKEIQFKMGTDNLWQTGFDFSDAIDDDGVWSYRLTGLGRSQCAAADGEIDRRAPPQLASG
jgi:iron complex outermembrane receptor protein